MASIEAKNLFPRRFIETRSSTTQTAGPFDQWPPLELAPTDDVVYVITVLAVDTCPPWVRLSLITKSQLPAVGGVAAVGAVAVKMPTFAPAPWEMVAILLHVVEKPLVIVNVEPK